MNWIRRLDSKGARTAGCQHSSVRLGPGQARLKVYLHIKSIAISYTKIQDNKHSRFHVTIDDVDNHGRRTPKFQSNGIKVKSPSEIQWVINQNLCLTESCLLITVVKHRQVVTDQVVIKVAIFLIDIVIHLLQSPDTAFITGSDYNIMIEIKEVNDILLSEVC
ncbi:hypothetical protein BDN72DRAFT_298209 [Pluteus cervinus]|uniref:Uncharacterized protein n=1 Tax=Pluteus cervinus TaxID=181527 RepID=A0ACD3ADS0_9AGAR|nr:hypothetical protein BDN72DRAFT_298209 [Pluteus cervinus]